MTMGPTVKMLSELYLREMSRIGDGWPAHFNTARREQLESIALDGLPDTSQEAYRHFNVRSLLGADRTLAGGEGCGRQVKGKFPTAGYEIDVVDGRSVEAPLRTTSEGAVYGSLRLAAAGHEELVTRYFNHAAAKGDTTVAMNTLFTADGAFIYIPKGVEVALPFNVTFSYGSDGGRSFAASRMLVIAEEGSSSKILVSHRSCGEREPFVSHVREVFAGESSGVSIVELSSFTAGSTLISSAYTTQSHNSRTTALGVWLWGGNTRANIVTELDGPGCESRFDGLYITSGQERFDMSMLVNHNCPDCNSYEMVKGVAAGSSTGAFTGKVFVAQDAQRTNALQQNRNLQLSRETRIFAEPQLEIYADDVKCSHGATIGQLDDQAILYMRQRGLSEGDARRLQMFGFVNDIISRCTDEQVCEHLRELTGYRIQNL